ncbi:hypothetical protein SKAU_G00370580 [Synaphobranchus kaupii]|uniref:L27 domain-containing protein n=1 Tax=Synaphobranchus kaupii TaxID=118154 RepID=A0A9Q1EG07_SYNKA|nr:hypothetical protein SKAU_G00370580 [Synaphobranchus kaupii]
MPLKREDTEKALQAMEACQSAADEGFRVRAEKLLHIFQSDLFQALLDIQEFYELTVVENQGTEMPQAPILQRSQAVRGQEKGLPHCGDNAPVPRASASCGALSCSQIHSVFCKLANVGIKNPSLNAVKCPLLLGGGTSSLPVSKGSLKFL